ncbi:protein FAM210A [Condylostylus longicornis]|uniref:protein FAM210A n=1 Tax=Condylostylus longicornis TaxID=2530218 RepID=UPI00244E3EC8|nr:protein FAM210A [Condylostylus longicornis]
MINRIPKYATNTLIKLCKEQNIYCLRTCTRNFNSPAVIKLSTICKATNPSNYAREYENIRYFNSLETTKRILPLVQNRGFCNKKESNSNTFSNVQGTAGNKNTLGSQEQQQEIKIDLEDEFPKKISIFAKFKLMYKKYWYVLIPVHLVTSAGWFFSFYLLSKSGVDIPTFLEYLRVSDSMIDKVRESDMGHYAIAYLCYKLATPLRYAVTLGGTTVSIRYLVRLGYIKPVPTKQQVMDKFKKAKDDIKQDLKQRRDTMVKKATSSTASKKSDTEFEK